MFNEHKLYKSTICRIVSCLLSAILVLPMMSVIALASGDNKIEISEERFCSNELTVENANVTVNSDGTVRLSANGVSPRASMEITPIKAQSQANALRIVLKNSSDFKTMNIEYIYENSDHISVPGTESVEIQKSKEAIEYIVPIEYADTMTHLVLSFGGSESVAGDITLVSIGALSYRYNVRKYVGAMTENSYDEATRMAKFSGSVSYETTLANSDACVVLYRLDPSESIENVTSAHAYVASLPMTLSFNFAWEVKTELDLCSRYFAAVLTKNNEILPLTPETYLENNYKNEHSEDVEDFFKGIETTLYAGASENGTSVAFVDVYLNKMASEEGDGFQYILEKGEKYYFDRSYITELDAVMRSYSLSKTAVYLRFLIDEYDENFGYINNTNELKNKKYFAINPCSDEIVNNIYAYSDFIVSRYASSEYGTLRGVVLGRSLNNTGVYNYCELMPMANYADMLARLYVILKNALDKNNENLEILMPMSDGVIGGDVLVDSKTRDEHYFSNLLAESIADAVVSYGIDLSSLGFVLESESLPACVSASDSQGITVDNFKLFTDAIKKVSENYEDLSSDVMFCWFPHDEVSSYELLATYMYNYNVLASSPNVRGYIISIFEILEKEDFSASEKSVFSTLKSTYKYADTYNNVSVSKTALDATGKEKWSDVVEGYELEKMIKRTLVEMNAELFVPENVIGTYKMWDFSSTNGLTHWRADNGCELLSVYTPSADLPRALVASFGGAAFDKYGADYGNFIYCADGALLVENISNISFDVIIPSQLSAKINTDNLFELKITIGAKDTTVETVGILKSDVRSQICVDVSNIDEIEYMKISLRSLDGEEQSGLKLCVNSISIHSKVYTDKELEDIVLSGKLTGGSEFTVDEKIDAEIVVAIITSVVVVAILICWGTFALKSKKRKN